MNKTVFLQTNSSWSKLPYKNRCTVGGSGCGLVSVAHCCLEVPSMSKYTPKTIHSYMRQFARDNDGTKRDGITTALKHYGFTEVKRHPTMAPAWKELDKGGRIGIVLFGSKTVGGIKWTTSAHYLAFVDYKKSGGKHYIYTKDSGWRKHTGWYCYETQFKGNCLEIWTCKKPAAKTTATTKATTPKAWGGTFPNLNVTTTSKSNSACINKVLAWAKKYADDNSYKYRKWSESNKYTHQCPICHPTSNKYATKGWNCRGFAAACFHHGGGVNTIECSCKGFGLLGKKLSSYTLENWKKVNGNDWERIYNNGKNLTKSQLKNGDIFFMFNSDKTMKHVGIIYDIANGKVVDSTSSAGISIRTPSSYGLVAFRYTGQMKSNVSYSVKAIKKGDTRKTEVYRLQSFLVWLGYNTGGVDGIAGAKTDEAIRKFQKAYGLTVDGAFGPASLAKAKTIKK